MRLIRCRSLVFRLEDVQTVNLEYVQEDTRSPAPTRGVLIHFTYGHRFVVGPAADGLRAFFGRACRILDDTITDITDLCETEDEGPLSAISDAGPVPTPAPADPESSRVEFRHYT